MLEELRNKEDYGGRRKKAEDQADQKVVDGGSLRTAFGKCDMSHSNANGSPASCIQG